MLFKQFETDNLYQLMRSFHFEYYLLSETWFSLL